MICLMIRFWIHTSNPRQVATCGFVLQLSRQSGTTTMGQCQMSNPPSSGTLPPPFRTGTGSRPLNDCKKHCETVA